MASSKPKLSRSEAEEFTTHLGQSFAGDAGQMDFGIHVLGAPKALGLENDEWVEKLGGFVRRSRQQLKDEIRDLSAVEDAYGKGEYVKDEDGKRVKDEDGNWLRRRSLPQIADVLGVSPATVERARSEIAVEPSREGLPSGEGPEFPSREGPLTIAERRVEVERMMDEGMTTAEMAVALDIGQTTIQKDRAAIIKKREADAEPLTGAAKERADMKAAEDAKPDEQKIREAKESEALGAGIDAMAHRMTSPLLVGNIISALNEARENLAKLTDHDCDAEQIASIKTAMDAVLMEFDVALASAGLDPR